MAEERPRLIICDDSPAYRRVIQGMLGPDYQFLLASSGEEVLARLDEFAPDLVISDLMMAGMDGYELCRRVKARMPLVPVVLLTSKTDDDSKATGLEVGADDYLFKPCRPRELSARVTSLIRLRRATMSLELAQGELVRTEKLASLGQLVAGIAHEINNPLNYIYGNIGFLNDYARALLGLIDRVPELPGFGDAQRRQWDQWKRGADYDYLRGDLQKLLDGISTGAERAAEIVKGLRMFARAGQEGEPEDVDLAKLVDMTLMVLRHELKDRISVVREIGAGLPRVRADNARLGQVFMNLILNATQAIVDKGGRGEIRISILRDGGSIRCSIRDDGVGMPPEVLARAFDPFFTTRAVGKGTGLGLSIAYGIVRQHGGSIELSSEPGAGTTALVTLPAPAPDYTAAH